MQRKAVLSLICALSLCVCCGIAIAKPSISSSFSKITIAGPGEYFLTLRTQGEGSIINSLNKEAVPAGTSVTLTAVPEAGGFFLNWTNAAGEEVSTANPYVFTMPEANKTLIANFSHTVGLYDSFFGLKAVKVELNPALNYADYEVFVEAHDYVTQRTQIPYNDAAQAFLGDVIVDAILEETLTSAEKLQRIKANLTLAPKEN